jgi:outer membrane protein assembly factor BamC
LHGRSAAVAETSNVNPFDARSPVLLRTVALAAACLVSLLSACTTTSSDGFFSGEKVDYSSAAAKSKPLEVPPDLTQLAGDARYRPQGGVVSASAVAAPRAAGPAAAAPAAVPVVALKAAGDLRIERQGQLRWLVAPQAPEPLWPRVRAFWEANGFLIEVEDAAAGVMETNWNENRAKLPKDAARNVLGGLLKSFFDTGERDRFRTRIERTPGGSEIYISHRSAQEVFIDQTREQTTWRAGPNNPDLEAEMLSRLMVVLGATPEAARTAVAAAPAGAAAATAATAATSTAAAGAAPPRARLLDTPGTAALEMDESFDRAWRQVGLTLDRSGFTVEDRDRASGVYYVRYVDPKTAGQEEPGFWSRMFGNTGNPLAPVRYRVALKGDDRKTTVSVLTSAGGPDVGENGRRIAERLVAELR